MKKRTIEILKNSEDFHSSFRRHLCIDTSDVNELIRINDLIDRKKKKFELIIYRTLTNNFLYWDCYNKENINNKASDITAIKFLDINNDRIYCKEIKDENGNLYIIMVLTIKKKSQKNNKNIINLINKINLHEYEI